MQRGFEVPLVCGVMAVAVEAGRMRVVHIGTTDRVGGAARAAYRLHHALLRHGHESRMLVGYKTGDDPEIDGMMSHGPRWRRALRRAAVEVDAWSGLQYLMLPWGRAFADHPFVRGADVIHLHNLHGGYFPLRSLPGLSRRAPLVLSLHDAWPLTGHCAYPYRCERWKTGCAGSVRF